MPLWSIRLALVLALAGIAALPARAADPVQPLMPPPIPTQPLWDVRIGVLAHDPWSPEKGSADLSAQVLAPRLFSSGDPLLNALIPRLTAGGSINFSGSTSHGYGGLAWGLDITPQLFVEATFGVGGNNGKTGAIIPTDRSAVGCNWNFYENISLGYRLGGGWSIQGVVEHISNAGLCKQNRGVTNLGARLGYSF